MTSAKTPTTTDGFLGGKVTLLQPKKGYRAGSDAVFLAASCLASPAQSVLELGCGVGAVLFCLGHRTRAELTGVEITPEIAALARRNAELNATPATIVTADIAALPASVTDHRYDYVLMNPPYFGSGTRAADAYRGAARHEDTALGDWIVIGLKRLAPGGEMILIHTAERLSELLGLLNSHSVCTEIKPLAPREGRSAERVILKVRRSKAATTILHNPLILHSGTRHLRDGNDFTPEVEAVLRGGVALEF